SYLYWSLNKTILSERRLSVRERLRTVVSLLETGSMTQAKDRVEAEWPLRLYERIYVRVISRSGELLIQTPNTPSEVVEEVFARSSPAGEVATRLGNDYLLLSQPVLINGAEVLVHVALDYSKEAALLERYRNRLIAVLVLALIVSGFIGRSLAKNGLMPVYAISQKARQIRSTTLHERIENVDLPVETRTLAETFNEMLDRLSDSFSRLSRFSSDIAHELRTPLNNIHGEIEVALTKTRTEEEYRSVLESSLEETDRIRKIIDSLLFLAKSENPMTQIAKERINLKRELDNIVDFFEASAAESGILTELSVPENLEVNVEKTLFQRAIVNLLSNAAHHTPEGGRILVAAQRNGEDIQISIRDTGEGIPDEDLPHVFDRFYRVDPSRTATKHGGFGLGLSIVQGIVKLHQGTIRIESRVGAGTTAIVSLPSGTALS
ncbi:MAG: heavy metal sensor histidine kinase, partial [Bdellovibrionota bacterium]